LRLSEADSARLKAAGGKPFSPLAGRPMAGYTVAPSAVWSSTPKLRPWVERAIRQARSLPPKTKKAASKK
jgi:TfoX/Sxy family transcriptional regulator of competence genes